MAARLVIEVRTGLGVGREVGVDEHDLLALHRRITLGDIRPAHAQGFNL